MTSQTVGIGLVGTGFIARAHAETFSRSAFASVRAVASRSADRAEVSPGIGASRRGIPITRSLSPTKMLT
jgi:hypothetical protein